MKKFAAASSSRLTAVLGLIFTFSFCFTAYGDPVIPTVPVPAPAPAPAHLPLPLPQKEWTFMVFINGNNSLSDFGGLNINGMEEVGSTDKINIVVQWASCSSMGWFGCDAANPAKRLLVQRDADSKMVTSPIVQDLGIVDMGDPKAVTDFVTWAHSNFPAQHYALSLWNHGSGWHGLDSQGGAPIGAPKGGKSPRAPGIFAAPADISFDDISKHSISTLQMGQIMEQSAIILGQKIDIYASDACLMAMGEIAAEMANSVNYFLGSEELEPGEGWPYSTILKAWAPRAQTSAKELSEIVVREYKNAYSPGGIYGQQEVTFSAMDLSAIQQFQDSAKALAASLAALDPAAKALVVSAIQNSQKYEVQDYVDFGDFLVNLETSKVPGIPSNVMAAAKGSLQKTVVFNETNGKYFKSTGLAIWLPSTQSEFKSFETLYRGLRFNQATGWADFLASTLK